MSFIGNARELGRERFIVLGSLLGVVALAWLYLWWEATQMAATPMATGDAMQAMAQPQTWQPHALVREMDGGEGGTTIGKEQG